MAGTSAGAKKGWASRKGGKGKGAFSSKGSGSKFVQTVAGNMGAKNAKSLTHSSHKLRSKKSREDMKGLIAYNMGKNPNYYRDKVYKARTAQLRKG